MKKLVTLAVAALAAAVFAQNPAAKEAKAPHARPMRPAPMMGGASMMMEPVIRLVLDPTNAEKLGITPEQAEKLKAQCGTRGAQAEIQKKMREGMRRQAELLQAEKIDEAAVMAVIDEVWDARKEAAKAQTRRVIAVKSILTPEQVKKALEEVRAMRGRRGPRPGARPGMSPRHHKAPAEAKGAAAPAPAAQK